MATSLESSTNLTTTNDAKNKASTATAAPVLVEEESRASGSVKLRLYKIYFNLVGNAGYWFVMASIILASRCLEVSEQYWLKIWSSSYSTFGNDTLHDNPTQIFNSSQAYFAPLIRYDDPTVRPPNGVAHLNYYLSIYCLITCVNACCGSLRCTFIYWGVLGANRKLYADLLHRVFHAPLRFFETTPMVC